MAPTPVDDATHSALLSDSLKRLQLKEQVPSSLVESTGADQPEEDAEQAGTSGPRNQHFTLHEGYGFRPVSGPQTPMNGTGPAAVLAGTSSPLPDPNGLGWPGEWY